MVVPQPRSILRQTGLLARRSGSVLLWKCEDEATRPLDWSPNYYADDPQIPSLRYSYRINEFAVVRTQGPLDFQYSYEPSGQVTGTPVLGVLTHTHQDHAGGTQGVLESGVPIIMSESVYQQLSVLQPWLSAYEQLVLQIPPTLKLSSEVDGTTFQFFPGAHSPGAMMVSVTTNEGDRLVYPGDYCLSNRYYRESPGRLSGIFEAVTGRKFLLVDGAFLEHGPITQTTGQPLEDKISELHSAKRPALFTAESPDYLFAAYMWYFQTFYARPKEKIDRHLVVHEGLLALIETTFEQFIRRKHDYYDPFLKQVLGTSMSNYLESQRLYPFSESLWPSDLNGAVDVFCPLSVAPKALKHVTSPFAIVLGRTWTDVFGQLGGLEALTLDGPDFSFHSAASDVGEIVRHSVACGIHPIMFHNFEKRIRRALKNQGIGEREFSVATTKPLSLR